MIIREFKRGNSKIHTRKIGSQVYCVVNAGTGKGIHSKCKNIIICRWKKYFKTSNPRMVWRKEHKMRNELGQCWYLYPALIQITLNYCQNNNLFRCLNYLSPSVYERNQILPKKFPKNFFQSNTNAHFLHPILKSLHNGQFLVKLKFMKKFLPYNPKKI